MTAPRITLPDGKPGPGTAFFVYRAKVDTGSSMHTAGEGQAGAAGAGAGGGD